MRVLITGANRGIGLALAKAYRIMGAEVIGTARAPDEGLLPLDVTEPASIAALAAALPQPLDLLVCNAGIYAGRGERLETGFAAADWSKSFATNVTGVFLTIQAFMPQLRAAKGKIAIISSRMGSDALAPGGSYIYRASKAAVLNLGRNLAVDLKPDGIAVGIYHPGWVKTDMGGPGADIGAETSAEALCARFAALSLADTGCFQDHSGEAVPF